MAALETIAIGSISRGRRCPLKRTTEIALPVRTQKCNQTKSLQRPVGPSPFLLFARYTLNAREKARLTGELLLHQLLWGPRKGFLLTDPRANEALDAQCASSVYQVRKLSCWLLPGCL